MASTTPIDFYALNRGESSVVEILIPDRVKEVKLHSASVSIFATSNANAEIRFRNQVHLTIESADHPPPYSEIGPTFETATFDGEVEQQSSLSVSWEELKAALSDFTEACWEEFKAAPVIFHKISFFLATTLAFSMIRIGLFSVVENSFAKLMNFIVDIAVGDKSRESGAKRLTN